MACILNIETATPLCSVALALNGEVIAQRDTLEEKSHAAQLTVFIEEILRERRIRLTDIDAIAVGKGPGSFTGLRIGVSVAKGLCYGAEIPLIAVGTLNILFNEALLHVNSGLHSNPTGENILFCPMIDARRMEVFSCLYDRQGHEIEPVAARIVDQTTYKEALKRNRVAFFGSGMEKCREMLSHAHALFLPDVHPKASALAHIAEEKFVQQSFENIAYFEPFYLKDFIATTSKKGIPI